MIECKGCRLYFDISNFYKKGVVNGIQRYFSKCKKCYYDTIRESKKISAKKYREENKDNISKARKKYKEKNKDVIKAYNKRNSKKNQERTKKWIASKKNDELYKSKEAIRKLMTSAFRRLGKIKTSRTFDILGCDAEYFKTYIESKFKDGMSWDNYGQYGWHFDHIIPLSSAKDEEDIIRLNHHTNFQPLWWMENLEKSNKIL